SGVVGEERERVASFAGEVVDGPDEPFASPVFPGGVSFLPVARVGLPGLERSLAGFAGKRIVEVGVRQQRFGGIGSGLQEILLRSCKLQVSLTDVLQAAVCPQVATLLVGGRNVERA